MCLADQLMNYSMIKIKSYVQIRLSDRIFKLIFFREYILLPQNLVKGWSNSHQPDTAIYDIHMTVSENARSLPLPSNVAGKKKISDFVLLLLMIGTQ